MATKTTQVRVDGEMAEQLRWLAEYDRVTALKASRRAKPAARILKDLAGGKVSAAYAKIEPWVKSVQAAMEG